MITDKKSYLAGMMLGERLRGMRPKRVPVAFLYNGVRLPGLPDVDRETYPYVCIVKTALSYLLTATTAKPYYNGSYLVADTDGTRKNYAMYTNGTISEWDAVEYEEGYTFGTPIWSEYDILNADGSVYLAASEPVPVYE